MVDISKLSKDEYIKDFLSSQPVEKTNILKNVCVGIAGAGGLGSVVAENLARAGVGKLVIADFDMIEPSNLNRQRFSISQLGMVKVEALCQNIKGFNPFIELVKINEKVTASNCAEIFKSCEVVAECFDRADEKAMLVSSLRKYLPEAFVVAVSGIAGMNEILVPRKIFQAGTWLNCDHKIGWLPATFGQEKKRAVTRNEEMS